MRCNLGFSQHSRNTKSRFGHPLNSEQPTKMKPTLPDEHVVPSHLLPELLQEALGAGRRPRRDALHRREVVPCDGRMRGQEEQERRHHEQIGRPELDERLDVVLRRELGDGDQVQALLEGDVHDAVEAVYVEEGEDGEHLVLAVLGRGVLEEGRVVALDQVRHQIVVAEHYALRDAGRAARVGQEGGAPGVDSRQFGFVA